MTEVRDDSSLSFLLNLRACISWSERELRENVADADSLNAFQTARRDALLKPHLAELTHSSAKTRSAAE